MSFKMLLQYASMEPTQDFSKEFLEKTKETEKWGDGSNFEKWS